MSLHSRIELEFGKLCQTNNKHLCLNVCIILRSPLHLLVYKGFTKIHPSPSFVYSITKIIYHCIHWEGANVYHISEVRLFCYPELKKENIINISKAALLVISQKENKAPSNILFLPVGGGYFASLRSRIRTSSRESLFANPEIFPSKHPVTTLFPTTTKRLSLPFLWFSCHYFC